MKNKSVVRDERTIVVENTSYRWAYLLLSFGLLADIAYRGFTIKETNWDLMGLVVLGGLVATSYQGIHKVLSRRWALIAIVATAAALIGAWGATTFEMPHALVMLGLVALFLAVYFVKVRHS